MSSVGAERCRRWNVATFGDARIGKMKGCRRCNKRSRKYAMTWNLRTAAPDEADSKNEERQRADQKRKIEMSDGDLRRWDCLCWLVGNSGPVNMYTIVNSALLHSSPPDQPFIIPHTFSTWLHQSGTVARVALVMVRSASERRNEVLPITAHARNSRQDLFHSAMSTYLRHTPHSDALLPPALREHGNVLCADTSSTFRLLLPLWSIPTSSIPGGCQDFIWSVSRSNLGSCLPGLLPRN